MNKRKIKKISKSVCPRCMQAFGIWGWRKLRTGKYVSYFVECNACGFQADGTIDQSRVIKDDPNYDSGWMDTLLDTYKKDDAHA